MISRYEAYMDGIALSSVHPSLVITDISHPGSALNINTNTIADRDGVQIASRRRANTSVSISFMLRIYNTAERQKAMQEVQRWASGSALEVSDRPGQVLYCVCNQMPVVSSVQKWTEVITMTFVSYEKPFWTEKYPAVFTATGKTGTGELFVPGNAGKVYAEALIVPDSTLGSISLTVGTTTITLTNVSATDDDEIRIFYDDRGIQHIRKGIASILSKRTGADDLVAECGKVNGVSFGAADTVTVTFSIRGCWL